ncbi:MlaD family protein [Nocardia sp. R7R-8]|uniref:MlaD family protein n=1 Tax=Nocardia sp. R7R-8 TaxID=3459304 RepID=UPI00403D56A8
MKKYIPVRLVGPALRLLAAGVVAALLFVLIQNAIKNPTGERPVRYSADFSDASGLRPNADIRIRGVRVGKVEAVELHQAGDSSVARVDFTVNDTQKVTVESKLAIKYANLSGVRFIDITGNGDGGAPTRHIGLDHTVPSFDITTLFNGLQPALETLQPNEINEFMRNALTLVQGDGSGLAPMLDSVDKLSRYTTDRAAVISTLVANLSRIAETLGGKSPQIIEFLRDIERPIDSAMTVLDEFPKAAKFGPPLMGTFNHILSGLGIDPSTDVDKILNDAFPTVADLQSALGLFPTIMTGLATPVTSPQLGSAQCSHGAAQLPATVRVLLGGSSVVVCNA